MFWLTLHCACRPKKRSCLHDIGNSKTQNHRTKQTDFHLSKQKRQARMQIVLCSQASASRPAHTALTVPYVSYSDASDEYSSPPSRLDADRRCPAPPPDASPSALRSSRPRDLQRTTSSQNTLGQRPFECTHRAFPVSYSLNHHFGFLCNQRNCFVFLVMKKKNHNAQKFGRCSDSNMALYFFLPRSTCDQHATCVTWVRPVIHV